MLETVNVEQTVQVVELVLENSSEPPRGFDLEGVAIDVLCTEQRALRAAKRETLAGERKAAFLLVFAGDTGDGWRDPQLRVDRDALRGGLFLIFVHPHEDALVHANLRSRKANTGRSHGCVIHVVDELAQICVKLSHRLSRVMQYGLAADRNGKNSHTSKNTRGDRLDIRDLQHIAGIRATFFLACPQEAPVSNTPAEQIVWIDCEMTGLDADLDGLCEIALIITDFDLKPLDAQGFEIIINPGEAAMEHMNDFVRGMHEKSGLLPKIAAGATVAEAEEQVLAYVNSLVTKGRRPLVAGNTIGMDRRFIAKYMPTLEERLHYRSIDVSTIKELSRRWYPNAYSLAPEKRGGHRALADIAESIQELAYFRDAAMLPLPGLERPAVKEVAAQTTDAYRGLIDDAIAGGKAE